MKKIIPARRASRRHDTYAQATIVHPTKVTLKMFEFEMDGDPIFDVTVDVRFTRDYRTLSVEGVVNEALTPLLARLAAAREIGDIHRDNFTDEIERKLMHGRINIKVDDGPFAEVDIDQALEIFLIPSVGLGDIDIHVELADERPMNGAE